jgi:CO/xanthine dehydrogenase Mo-binding subunit
MVLGQVYGGLAMGIGYALHEDLGMREGRITNVNLNRYRIPRITDVPEMTAILLENPDPVSPTGAKGVGEPTNELMAPAIANAVFHATGRRYRELPIRVEGEARAERGEAR